MIQSMECELNASYRVAIGAEVAALRSRLGISQNELARQTRLSPGYINAIEKGTKMPSPRVLQLIGEVLGVPGAVISLLATDDNEKVVRVLKQVARKLVDAIRAPSS